ncbi:sec-independent translocase [Streptomyces sodiiphilus]|uniref:Sec-independent protein translocase protein TatB n=1 Tax=Streptomyces sodiiphilus TaxID=226217 RepID=A0ABN2NVD9_9ACTN
MFFDIGSLEFIALIILAILVFGPDKLPKMIQDTARFVRKIREFSDSAKRDIRSELGPEFKDFEFDDLNPRRFAKKHLLDPDELGLKELRSGLDVSKELTEVSDSVNGRSPARPSGQGRAAGADSGTAGRVNLAKGESAAPPAPREEPPPFDADAT